MNKNFIYYSTNNFQSTIVTYRWIKYICKTMACTFEWNNQYCGWIVYNPNCEQVGILYREGTEINHPDY